MRTDWADQVAGRLAPRLRRTRSFPGGRRLCDWAQRAFTPRFRGPEGWAWVDDFEGRLRVRVHRGHHIGGTIYWHGAHSLNELALLRRRAGPGRVFIDGGAHLGHFSLVAAAKGARVVAVEPVAAVRTQLTTNLEANGFEDVIIRAEALHDHRGRLTLFADPRQPDDPVATSWAAYGRTERIAEVDTITLDALSEAHDLPRVDIIKLDLEGAELFALRGARRVLERDRPELILELSAPLFEAAGYAQYDLLDLLDQYDYCYGLIGDFTLQETLRRPARGRYGRVRPCRRCDLPVHGNIYAAPAPVFDDVASA